MARLFLALSLLLLAACTDRAGEKRNWRVHPQFHGQFETVAYDEHLGASWEAADGTRAVWSEPAGQRALIVLRGSGVPALWLNRERSLQAVPLELGHMPEYVDAQAGIAYAIDAQGLLVSRELPDGDWVVRFGADGPEQTAVIRVAAHPSAGTIWVALRAEPPALATPPDAPTSTELLGDDVSTEVLSGPRPTMIANDIAEERGTIPPQLHRLPPAGAVDTEPPTRPLLQAVRINSAPGEPIDLPGHGPVQIAALADGSAVAAVAGTLYLLRDGQPAREIYAAERELTIAADNLEPVVWVYVRPRSASSGTGRATIEPLPGIVLALKSDGSELARMAVGDVALSQLVGDWTNRRAVLARSSVGALALDFAAGRAYWPLRQGGDIPLHLVGGQLLWAVTDEGIIGITTHELLELAPQLAANQVLNREQSQRLRPVVEALGWRWSSVQVSPLMGESRRLTLFNAADISSEVAELDWSAARGHVSRLLIVRRPTETDRTLASPEATRELLATLGWSNAVQQTPGDGAEPSDAADEFVAEQVWSLDGNVVPPASPGEFRVWVSDDSTLLSLDAPTQPFPADALDPDSAREAALDELARRGTSTPAQVTSFHAGWVGSSGRLLPESDGESLPAYQIEARVELPECQVYKVLLSAADGNVLHVAQTACGPLVGRAD